METFVFGPGDRLFGAYYEGFGPATAPAVLFCNGLGQDYMRTHFVLRHLARRLSAIAGPVLQFDYRGTGDSWGESGGITLELLREDTAVALQELHEISGRSRAVLLGIRLGAWLALDLGERVVAWDPLLSGDDYIASLRAMTRELSEGRERETPAEPGAVAESEELAGYRYARALLEELVELDLQGIVDQKRFERLALIANEEEPDRDDVVRILEPHTDTLQSYPAKPAEWKSLAQLERALTPFPALNPLCEDIAQW